MIRFLGEMLTGGLNDRALHDLRDSLAKAYPGRKIVITYTEEEIRWPWRRSRRLRVHVYELAAGS